MNNMELVSLEERRYLAKNCVKEMGKEVKIKVLDMPAAVEYMRDLRKRKGLSPFVIVKPVYENKHKEMRLSGTYQRDPETGVYYGIPVREDQFGNVIWRKVRVVESETFHIMSSLNDAMIWTVLRFHPKLGGSPWAIVNPIFRIFDPAENARKDVAKAKAMGQAFNVIKLLAEKPLDMLNFARYMGEEITDYTSIGIIDGTLHSLAMNDPYSMIRKYNEPGRAYGQIFLAAYQTGLIGEIPGQGFYYKNTPLGMDMPDVINFLKKDKVIISTLIEDIQMQDPAAKSIIKEVSKGEGEKETEKTGVDEHSEDT